MSIGLNICTKCAKRAKADEVPKKKGEARNAAYGRCPICDKKASLKLYIVPGMAGTNGKL